MKLPFTVVFDLETIQDPALVPRWPAPDDRVPVPPHHQIVCGAVVVFRRMSERIGDAPDPLVFYETVKIAHRVGEIETLDYLLPILGREDVRNVGWNTRGFDIPVLVARAFRNGIAWPEYFNRRDLRYRYSDAVTLDMMDQLSDFGAASRSGADVFAKSCGFPGKGEITGADVAGLVTEGRTLEVAKYCCEDALNEAGVFLRLEFLRGELTADGYTRSVEELLAVAEAEGHADFVAKVDRTRALGVRRVDVKSDEKKGEAAA